MLCTSDEGGPIVLIDQGKLIGKRRKTVKGTRFSSFTRIPYASPPVGDRRFKKPSEPPLWHGTLDAGRPCPKPLQSNYVTGLLEGQEDCLYLNVYIPELPEVDVDPDEPLGLLPVMFWMYGGGFIMGDASEENYLPGPLLDTKEVVIVTANYRVGPLGFLCMEDDLLPGNLALWDQRAALMWVKNNIRMFGGDPDNVTIFGESAGSFCMMCLYVSPLSRGLFHRAIAQSGPLISNCSALQMMGKRPQLYARSYAERLGCGLYDTSEEIMEKLLALPASKLQGEFNFAGDWAPMCPSPWKPVVDIWADEPILPKDPRQALLEDGVPFVPLMTGTCQEEGLLNVAHLLKEPIRWNLFCGSSWWKYLSMVLFHNHEEDLDDEDKEVILRIAKEYDLIIPGESRILNYGCSKVEKSIMVDKLIHIFTDAFFKAGTLDLCKILAKHAVPVYQYRFVYAGSWKFVDLLTLSAGQLALKFMLDTASKGKINLHGPHWEGVCHADELHYLFSPQLWGTRNTLPNTRDQEMSMKMAKHWVNFAATGNPSIDVRWDTVEEGGTRYLELDVEDTIKTFTQDEINKFNLWTQIFSERGKRKFPSTPLVLRSQPITKRIDKQQPIRVQIDKPQLTAKKVDKNKPITKQIDNQHPITKQMDKSQPIAKQMDKSQPTTNQIDKSQPMSKQMDKYQPITKQIDKSQPTTKQIDEKEPIVDEQTQLLENQIKQD